MPLPFILNIPQEDTGWDQWAYWHDRDHIEIHDAIFKLKGINLPIYVIYPVDRQGFQGWLERHQQYHNDMNGVLGLNGDDLTGLDPNKAAELQAWLWLNFSEHQNARTNLAI